jgi:hypothetical protein
MPKPSHSAEVIMVKTRENEEDENLPANFAGKNLPVNFTGKFSSL